MKESRLTGVYHNPIKMAIAVVALLLLCQLLFAVIEPLMDELIDERSPWVVTVAMMFFFILFNAVSTFTDSNLVRHWGRSIYGFMILGAAGYLSSWLISGKRPGELEGFTDIILIVFIGFIVLRSIASTIMVVVLFTRQRDAKKRARDEKSQY